MRVFVGGATGYIGAAVVKVLRARGHEVLGSARNDAAAAKVKALGATPVEADLSDAASFGKAAKMADATIQAASTADAKAPEYEPKAAKAILDALAGTSKRFILTGGVWVYGNTKSGVATEDSPFDAPMLVAWREGSEQAVLKADGIIASVIRPGVVYGHGGGIPAMFVGSAKNDKKVGVPGDGKNRWSTVHVDDLAELYAIVLEKGAAHGVYNGTDDATPTLGDIGRAIAKRHNAEFATWPLESARQAMGLFADALALDQAITSPKSKALGWQPKAKSLLDEVTSGSYA